MATSWIPQTGLLLSPAGDLSLDDYGRLVEDKTVVTRCLIRLMTRRGAYWRDPTMGSRLHEITTTKDARVRVQRLCEEALAPMIQDGSILAVETGEVEEMPSGQLRVQIFIHVTEEQIADIGALPLGGVL